MGSAYDWARELKQQSDAEQAGREDAKQMGERQRRNASEQLPVIWNSLISEFEKCCNAYNEVFTSQQKLILHRPATNVFTVKPDALEDIVYAVCDSENNLIRIHTGTNTIEQFSLANGTAEEVELVSMDERYRNLESIAQEMLKQGLRNAGLLN